jgi:hypothetical protein
LTNIQNGVLARLLRLKGAPGNFAAPRTAIGLGQNQLRAAPFSTRDTMVRVTLPGAQPLKVTWHDYQDELLFEPACEANDMLGSRAGRRYGQVFAVGKDVRQVTSC